MSDGNFNTKLLAPGGFAGGVRTGEARMRQKALTAFEAVMQRIETLSTEEKEALKKEFHALITR